VNLGRIAVPATLLVILAGCQCREAEPRPNPTTTTPPETSFAERNRLLLARLWTFSSTIPDAADARRDSIRVPLLRGIVVRAQHQMGGGLEPPRAFCLSLGPLEHLRPPSAALLRTLRADRPRFIDARQCAMTSSSGLRDTASGHVAWLLWVVPFELSDADTIVVGGGFHAGFLSAGLWKCRLRRDQVWKVDDCSLEWVS
jgi:hypothetical protein